MQDACNEIAYKCPACGWVARYNISKTITKRPDEDEYIHKIIDRRDGICLYLPPHEEWKKESEEIRRQLEALGYVGGR